MTRSRLLPAAGLVLLVVLGLVALHTLAAQLTTRELAHAAADDLAAYRAGGSPWSWRFASKDDLVAGRAFGPATLSVAADGLVVESSDGTPFELGLPLGRPADLARLSSLRLDIRVDRATTLTLVARESERGPPRIAVDALKLSPSAPAGAVRLDRIAWNDEHGMSIAPPAVASMLRLRVAMPRGARLTLRSAELAPPGTLAMQTPPPLVTEADLRSLARTAPLTAIPLIEVPRGLSAEQGLRWRDTVRQWLPSAVLVPATGPISRHRPGTLTTYLVGATYLLLLILLAWRPVQARWRAWLDIAACLAGPLWLLAGLQLGSRPALVPLGAFVAGLLYGAHLVFARQSGTWRWLGTMGAYGLPLLVVPVALALAMTFGQGLSPVAPGHALTYLGWALLQQWLMLAVVLGRLETVASRKLAIGLTAFAFALLHTPNGLLMQLCFGAELFWAWCFLRSRALVPVAIAHAASALLLESALGGTALRSLEVSARFFQ
jgi:membrane protease YdiL (CAAX protease family)